MASTSIDPVPKSRPYWLLIALACLVPAVLDAFKSYVTSLLAGGQVDWGGVVFAGSEWLFLGALTPITYVLSRRYPLRRETIVRAVPMHFIGAIALCIGWATLGLLLGLLLNRFPAEGHLVPAYVNWLLTSLPWSVFMYFTVLGCVYAFTYYRESRERESQQARLATQLAEARLGALRMQLHPHFLFNSLNAITVLVRDQNTRDASRMLELLSGVLRHVLQSGKRQWITLDEEIRFLEQYLEIEQVRFSDRLEVVWSIEDTVQDALVPEFILQPIVENAVRHGIAKRIEGGVIEISARDSDGELVLTVRDNGPGYYPTPDMGLGLANTRARLETLFGESGRLEVINVAEGGTIVAIRCPLKRANDA
ncbi:MAG TPA: histidine kinase [Pyrinomonadaceae bacterium]|nr:histidine kinase [Pyrinomonadaceae bacterium]